jgi:two-component system, OmpR family, phosphate regulon sensor histidine kinase PhoR
VATRTVLGAALIAIILAVFFTAGQPGVLRDIVLTASLAGALILAFSLASGLRPQVQARDVQTAVSERAAEGFDDIIDTLPVGVMTIGPDGRIGVFNTAAAEIFGVFGTNPHGRALIEIVRNSELDRRVSGSLRSGTSQTAEIVHSGATERRLLVTTRPRNGDPRSGIVVIVADQSRMRELESQRREFVSNVSHELRTPLTAVKLMVETLQSGVDAQASEQFLRSMAHETERMIALVEDLLDLARLESGKLELRLSEVDVCDLCRQAAQAQRPRAQASEITLVCSVPDEKLVIAADHDKLYQVITNLLDNALRHTPAHGTVTLRAAREDGAIAIEVADTGTGIPSSALPHIFERFFVVDPARTRGHSGTGLGLAIVKHIIEAHGGTIVAQSELGSGASFRCVLPAGLQTSRAPL